MENIIYYAISLAVAIVGWVFGRYVFPKINIDTNKLQAISDWVYKFVVSAKNQFEGKYTGEQKLAYVTEQVKVLCNKYKITLTDEQIRALIEDAYDIVKDGQSIIFNDTEEK
jgi:uncharacterized protein YpuA (DUF1002 family)